jgi:hypothetical protein
VLLTKVFSTMFGKSSRNKKLPAFFKTSIYYRVQASMVEALNSEPIFIRPW